MVPFANFVRLIGASSFAALCGACFGCVLLTELDERRISEGAGGSVVGSLTTSSGSSSSSNSSSSNSSSSNSSSSSSSSGSEFVCHGDGECPGTTNECGKPRCFSDGLCGFDNEPLGAPCMENGGHACDGKGQCIDCTANVHCASGKCGPDRKCLPPTCSDDIKNGDETDVDCGGSCTARCGPFEACGINGDCVGGVCLMSVCAPSCTDQIGNGSETDNDCGGPDCTPCSLGQMCLLNTDCLSALCNAGQCVPIPTCTDGVANGAETAIDCGGPDCAACAPGSPCLAGSDCTTLSCVMGICAEATCNDGVQNGNEPAVDCGAMCPMGCPPGTPCTAPTQCASKKCEGPVGNTVCGVPSCFDGIWNGDETSYDCGGSCENKCPPLYPCLINADCRGGLCDPIKKTCTPTCFDGYTNQGETDPDCGGPCVKKCPEGWHCYLDDDCDVGLYCTQGHCLP